MGRRLLMSVFGLLVAVCCNSQALERVSSPAEINMAEKNSLNKISLSGSGRVEKDKLIVEYTFRNDSDRFIYVFDEMIAYDGYKPKIDRSTAYCFFEEPRTLRLVRALLQSPVGKRVNAQEIPYARPVKPRSEVKGKIELGLPVKEKSPYFGPPKEEDAKIVDLETIRLILGWTENRDGVQIMEVEIGGEKVTRIRGNWKPNLVEDTFSLPVKVMLNTDPIFDRRMPAR